jgi:hypothetical protein
MNHQAIPVVTFMLVAMAPFGALAQPTVADLEPIALSFRDMPREVVDGKLKLREHQLVTISFRNVGNVPVKAWQFQECVGKRWPGRNAPCDLVITSHLNKTKITKDIGIARNQNPANFALNYPNYVPGQTYTWQFLLPRRSLKHCQAVTFHLDSSRQLDQYAAAYNVYKNDVAQLVVQQEGQPACPRKP